MKLFFCPFHFDSSIVCLAWNAIPKIQQKTQNDNHTDECKFKVSLQFRHLLDIGKLALCIQTCEAISPMMNSRTVCMNSQPFCCFIYLPQYLIYFECGTDVETNE